MTTATCQRPRSCRPAADMKLLPSLAPDVQINAPLVVRGKRTLLTCIVKAYVHSINKSMHALIAGACVHVECC